MEISSVSTNVTFYSSEFQTKQRQVIGKKTINFDAIRKEKQNICNALKRACAVSL